MSISGPPLKSRHLWDKREANCLAVIEHALLLLRKDTVQRESEVDLNRRLYFCLLVVSRKLFPEDVVAPTFEGNNQPDPDDEARSLREQKRPDFQWIYLDRYEPDPERSCRQFVVECKRLGKSARSNWVLNSNYIEHGVRRFRDSEWAYAKRFPSGAMVGYWQSMEADQVLDEVNLTASRNSLSNLRPGDGWNYSGVSKLEQTFERPFDVSPFHLWHLWVDVRDTPAAPAPLRLPG